MSIQRKFTSLKTMEGWKFFIKAIKKIFFHLWNEIFEFGIGWVLGLVSVQLVLTFFEEKGMTNLWGIWSDKIVVEEMTLSIIEWVTSAIIGYIVMNVINSTIAKIKISLN